MPLKAGVKECLNYLKDKEIKTAVASSSSENSVMHHLENAGITHFFDEIICGDKIEKSKPEPDIYLAAASALGEEPKDCYAVEDSRSGLLSAHRAGCEVVFIPDLYKPDKEIQNIIDLKFEALFEFKEYIKKRA